MMTSKTATRVAVGVVFIVALGLMLAPIVLPSGSSESTGKVNLDPIASGS